MTTTDTGTRPLPIFMELAELDWVWLGFFGTRLHHVAHASDPETWQAAGYVRGMTTCGRWGDLSIPGVFSRIGTERCAHCCDKLGIKRGTGSPKNDPELLPFAEARLSEATP